VLLAGGFIIFQFEGGEAPRHSPTILTYKSSSNQTSQATKTQKSKIKQAIIYFHD
jgi:hypothetical protein